jgi:hypothetical protein
MSTGLRTIVLTLDGTIAPGFSFRGDASTLQVTMSPHTPWADVLAGLRDTASESEIVECQHLFEDPCYPRGFEVTGGQVHIHSITAASTNSVAAIN